MVVDDTGVTVERFRNGKIERQNFGMGGSEQIREFLANFLERQAEP